MWKMGITWIATTGALLAGCGGHVAEAPAPAGDGGSPTSDAAVTAPADTLAVDDGITGTWTGYVESYRFASGSDALTLSLASDGAGHVTGTLTFGAGSPPPMATSPDVALPPLPRAGCGAGLYVVEALPFVLHDGSLATGRFRFSVLTSEAWKPFCELQTKTFLVGSDYHCVPGNQCTVNNGTCYYAPPSTEVDCGKLGLCMMNVCTCTATGCTIAGTGDVSFDLVVANGAANGSTTGTLGDKNVRLTRVK